MKVRSLLALLGLAISIASPTFAQQTNTPDPHLRQQIVPLSVIGRWGQTFKGKSFGPTQLDDYASSIAVREVAAWKKRLLAGLNSLKFKPVWSLPSKFFYSAIKAPVTSLFTKR